MKYWEQLQRESDNHFYILVVSLKPNLTITSLTLVTDA